MEPRDRLFIPTSRELLEDVGFVVVVVEVVMLPVCRRLRASSS